MKLVIIEEVDAPEVVDVKGNEFILWDTRLDHNFEEGDLVQMLSEEFGTTCYLVTEVRAGDPAYFERGLNLVTIEEFDEYFRMGH